MTLLKRYNTFSDDLKRRFGCKVQRISVDAGFSCPNRDGSLGVDGCLFCGEKGSASHGIRPGLAVAEQLEDGKEVMRRKYRAAKYLAYFQAFSNTYAPPARLRELFSAALAVPEIVGLIVATRPDCLGDEVLLYLEELQRQTYFWLELGMQSSLDRTLNLINRQHSHSCTVDAIRRAKSAALRVCVHLVLGLPGETRDDMLGSIAELNRLGVDGVKLHLLHVMKGTRLAEMYAGGGITLLDRDEYAGFVCDCLEMLDPRILIHRLTGDGGHENLVAPLWSLRKFEVLNLIDAEMERRGVRQGATYQPS